LQSTHPERIDDVRDSPDEMINKFDMGGFGSKLLLVGQALYFQGEHPLSCVKERQTENYISQLLKQCFVTHILVLLLNVVAFHYILCKLIYILITTMDLFNKKFNMQIKC